MEFEKNGKNRRKKYQQNRFNDSRSSNLKSLFVTSTTISGRWGFLIIHSLPSDRKKLKTTKRKQQKIIVSPNAQNQLMKVPRTYGKEAEAQKLIGWGTRKRL